MQACAILTAALLLASAQRQDPVTPIADIENPEELIERLGPLSEAVFHDGDLLTFLFRTDAAEAGLKTMIDASIARHRRTDLHLGQVEIADSRKLLMSYSFTENDENGWDSLVDYRGPDAPPIPQSVSQLAGKHIHYSIESEHLGGRRGIEVYVPEGEHAAPLPVVYMTDGAALQQYVGAIDWKIQQGEIRPLLVVGVHNGGYIGNRDKRFQTQYDHRALEYLSGLGDERYDLHRRFLREEVLPFIEQHHGASTRREDRVLSGYSNGGACAVTVGVEEADLFGTVCAYSVAFFDRDALRTAAREVELPRFRLAAGTLESFLVGTQDAHEILANAGADASLRTYVAGHDPLLWRVALLEDLTAIFPK